MRILAVSQYYPPDITAAAFRIGETVAILREKGHDVRVITARPHKASLPANQVPTTLPPAASSMSVLRVPLFPRRPSGRIAYLFHYGTFFLGSTILGTLHRLRGWKPDVIWASSPPLLIGLTGSLLSRWYSAPLVLEIRDLWPESAAAAGQLSRDSSFYSRLERLEGSLYNRAYRIVAVSQPMQAAIASRTTTPVAVVYNGVPEAALIRTTSPQTSSDLQTRNAITYVGNLGRVQELDLLLKAFAALRQEPEYQNWIVRLVGDGVKRDELVQLRSTLGLGDAVQFVGPLSKDEAYAEMRAASLLYLALPPDPALEKTIPSKLFDYLLSERPIIGGLSGEAADILRQTGGNRTFQPGSMNDLCNAIRTAIRDLTSLRFLSLSNPELVRKDYTRELQTERLADELNAAARSQHHPSR